MMYISHNANKYYVQKSINNKNTGFGVYDNQEQAIQVRDMLIHTKWRATPIPFYYQRKKCFLRHVGNKWQISRNGTYYGTYPNLYSAMKMRDFLIAHKWAKRYIKYSCKRENTQYHCIYRNKGGYSIRKSIKGEIIYFGYYDTLDEAVDQRDWFEVNNWDTRLINTKKLKRTKDPTMRYITKHHGKYEIIKQINGKQRYFGSYNTLREAKHMRKKLIKNNWCVKE